jgi:SAM-dependent methyltransferase
MMQAAAQNYGGHRILEAMRSAPRYAEAIYRRVRSANAEDGPLLDFGAGDGVFTEYFLHDGIRVECVEPDAKNIDALCALGVKVTSDISLLPDTQFGFAYTINVLEHLRDVDYYLGQLHRVLRQNGLLFVFVPAFNLLWTSLDDEVGHVQRFTRRSLHRYLERAGFKVEKSRYFDSAGFLAAFAVKILEAFGLFRYSPETVGFYDKAILPISLAGDIFLSSLIGKNVIAIARKI